MTVQSTIVFEGTITQLGATTVSTVSSSPHTAIVKVKKIFKGQKYLQSFTGKYITVLLRDISGLKKSSNVVFFTTGWIIGKNVALREVGRLQQYNTARLGSSINTISSSEALKLVEANIRKADIVLAGQVTKIQNISADLKDKISANYISEHAPQWKRAVIQPNIMLKGEQRLKTLEVLFPGSNDVAWYNIPKLSIGQQGIWILKMDVNIKMYAIKYRHDFQPIEQLDQIRTIISRIQ